MIDKKEPPYLLCEIANVHGGDKSHLYKVIDAFKEVVYPKKGIKFQIFEPDKIALKDFSWYPVYKELFFSRQEWSEIIDQTAHHGDIWIDIFDLYGVEVLGEKLDRVTGLKLQASVLNNHEVFSALSSLALSKKKIIINVSAFELSEIEEAVDRFQCLSTDLVLQIGYQSYPTAVEDTGLSKIPVLKAAFPSLDICMADHADASTEFALHAPAYAFLMGANYIEKHFCLSRDGSKYDKFSAVEPPEMLRICNILLEANEARMAPFISESEKEYLSKSKQVPVLRAGLSAGDLVGQSDVIYRRTAQSGLDSRRLSELQAEGKVLSRDVRELSTLRTQDYRNARIGVVVAGRMKSTRLPQKAVLPIAGIASVERCLRQCLAIDRVDQVILATSSLESDETLTSYTLDGRVVVWRGDPDDVIGRYLGACDKYDLDVIVRVTADCPLVLPDIVDFLIFDHLKSGADYTAAKTAAVGSSAEIINVNALRRVAQHFGRAEYSEYMTWYFQNNSEFFKVNLVSLPHHMVRDYRLTLDYQEDLDMFEKLCEALGSSPEAFRSNQVFDVLDSSQTIASINADLTLRYRTDAELIETLNRETKM